MQFPVIIGLHRSFFQRWAVVLVSVLVLGGLITAPWSWPLRALMIGAFLILAGVALRHAGHPVRTILLSTEGQLSIQFRGREDAFFPVSLKHGLTVHPWLSVLHLDYESHPLTLLITPDCLSTEDFRRLRVWLKWKAIFGDADDGA